MMKDIKREDTIVEDIIAEHAITEDTSAEHAITEQRCPLADAQWIGAGEAAQSPIMIRRFEASKVQKATLYVTGLGYFEAKVNGQPVCAERFIPVVSDFEKRDLTKMLYPLNDVTTNAVYYYEYDVTALLTDGANELTIQLGNGFYRQLERVIEGPHFGDVLKAIYALELETADGKITLTSDGSETCKDSEITYNNLFIGEVVDANVVSEERPVIILADKQSELRPAIGTPDRVIRKITPTLLGKVDGVAVFDVGENVSGIARIHTKAAKGEKIRMQFAEVVDEDLKLNFKSLGAHYICASGRNQIMEDIFVADGTERDFEPKFVWHTFRYFTIAGDFESVEIDVIHSDADVTARFESPSEGLTFLLDAYLRTQLDNMHGSIPSDCPHRERLGYTGDGQICAPTAMMVLDSEPFYRKWIQDILDCQCKISGHVQHTAPLMGGGGGPGGWGCAIVMVPYAFYKQFGDKKMIETCYEPMKHWIRYLLNHSEGGLVVREEEGGWCLGEWLTLEPTIIPEPYVNTCYLVKSLRLLSEMAEAIGKHAEAEEHLALAEEITTAIRKVYLNEETGHYCDGIQGADAYAVWAGLVKDEELEEHVVALAVKYWEMGHFDTGFMGTDILAEVLIDHGYADVLLKLFESEELGSFLYMKRKGATTIWEDWHGNDSLCHPMFGGSCRQLFTGFLGIRQCKDSAGFEKVEIAPRIPAGLPWAKGSIVTPKGEIAVSWEKKEGHIAFEVTVPQGMEAVFTYNNVSCELKAGRNHVAVLKVLTEK